MAKCPNLAGLEQDYATRLVTFLGDGGGADGTLWANSTSASLGYQQGRVDRINLVLDAYAGAEKTFAIMAETGHEESESQESKCPVRIFRKP